MAYNLMLIAGVTAGLCFDVFGLAALCFALVLVGLGLAVWTGAWHATMNLALGIVVLQIGYAAGIFVVASDLHSGPSARFSPDP